MSAVPMNKGAASRRASPYSGYDKREVPPPDAEITLAGPGTPLGEYMRRFWQPVCLSEQLKDRPHPIRILNEDLVAFRDGRGRVGVLHRHCCHRGASLEFGIIQECGIRCCYHGFQYDIDGTLIEVPGERDRGERLRKVISQGAYPTLERDGLVFAYLGPGEDVPPFPEYDAFEKYGDTRLVPFTNVFPCNWLQVIDNICDQMHTSFLHNIPFLYGGTPPTDLDWQQVTLSYFSTVPVMDYIEVRGGSAMCFVAGRRVSDGMVWIRTQDCIVPNMTEHAYLFENGTQRRLFHRVHMARWYVPVDDTHSIIFGWRMFGSEIDPFGKGDESRVGWDDMDFLGGQVGDRSYEEGQRLPGDWEAISSQRPIAIHALENPMESDIGVYMFRKLLRQAVRGKTPAASPDAMHAASREGRPTYCYTQNNVLAIPRRDNETDDRAMIKKVGRRIVEAAAEADSLAPSARREFMRARLAQIEQAAPSL
ncbi:MAG TPA: Rieske 2Fe-2S domain-containing protein [Casimicrobiaceae bacterium]|nr:Rieske 2Fe-2S domain-containing protein [Casimicrobiaceae bacterium]